MVNQDFKVTATSKIFRHGNSVEIKELGREDPNRTERSTQQALANVGKLKGKYWVFGAVNAKLTEQPLWVVLKSTGGPQGVEIGVGDIIKLGRCKYTVKELVTQPVVDNNNVVIEFVNEVKESEGVMRAEPNNDLLGTQIETGRKPSMVPAEKKEEKVQEEPKAGNNDQNHCRVCLGTENTPEDPLIDSPCKCIGSVKLIHSNCLQRWLKDKITKRETPFVTSYSWKPFECDLCKTKYPDVIVLQDGRILEIIDIKKPEANYMVLQTVTPFDHNTVHVISLGKKDAYKIGRGHENDIRLGDISVSRTHAELRVVNGTCYIKDLYSKFGTLLLLKHPIHLKQDRQFTIQAGRTVMQFNVIDPCCNGCIRTKKKPEEKEEMPTQEEIYNMVKEVNAVPLTDNTKVQATAAASPPKDPAPLTTHEREAT